MIKTNIKLRVTPKQSEAIQKICFDNNIGWGKELELNFLDSPCLFIDHSWIAYSDNIKFYNKLEEEEVDADLFIRTNGTCVEPTEECQFAKYGFEKPDFECEILGEIDGVLYGATWIQINSTLRMEEFNWYPEQWDKVDGSAHNDSVYDLKPIKKPWYETCKFPILAWDEDNDLFAIRTRGEYAASYLDTCKPLTNNEIEELKQ